MPPSVPCARCRKRTGVPIKLVGEGQVVYHGDCLLGERKHPPPGAVMVRPPRQLAIPKAVA